MPRRRVALAAALALALAGLTGAAPKPAPPADNNRETEAFLRQMGDAQKWMGEEIWKIREKVDELPSVIAEGKDDQAATREEIDKLRDEVKGLYVEISSVKQQIDGLKSEIEGVNGNLTSFRSFSGLFLASVLIMVAISTVMTVLRR